MQLSLLSLFAALLGLTLADVEFTRPAAGASIAGGSPTEPISISVEFKDSGDAPAIADLTTYQLFLCAGGNTDGSFIQLAPITTNGIFAGGLTALGSVASTIGANVKNAYFLKMISVAKTGGTVTNYSSRFSLPGMTGSFPPVVTTGLSTVTGLDGPKTENAVSKPAAPGAPVGGPEYAVPFYEQTGPTRYAPMQKMPGTKITKKNASPLFPTSSVVIAKTFLPPNPSVATTMTLPMTYSIVSMENTAQPAPQPSDDMQKYLNRWKD